jgi:hypothetical protein
MSLTTTSLELQGVWEAIKSIREHLEKLNGEGEENTKRLAGVETICTEIKTDLRWLKGILGTIAACVLAGLITWIARGH